MANVSVMTAVQTGYTGAPGYTKIHLGEINTSVDANSAGAAFRAFLDALKAFWVVGWNYTITPTVQQYDVSTGKLVSEVGMTTPPTAVNGTVTAGTGAAAYAGGTGLVLNWVTGVIVNGRKVRGRTFIVPVVQGLFSTDGTISSATITTCQAAGATFIGALSTHMQVWSRQFDNAKPPNQIGGQVHDVQTILVPDRAAQLRTRRS